jgi:hypothetical protein
MTQVNETIASVAIRAELELVNQALLTIYIIIEI